jgi:protein ImuB
MPIAAGEQADGGRPMTAVRTLVVWCPDWPVVAAGAVPDEPAAVLVANRVVAATPAARVSGVGAGQRRRQAQGRCPDLVVLARHHEREARAFEAVARVVEARTPRLEIAEPGTCAFPTRGPSRYFGGDHALARGLTADVGAVLAARGWPSHARIGVADGPFAARLAARSRRHPPDDPDEPVVIGPGHSPAFLAPLPIAALGRPDLTDVLERLGLRTLGAFAALDAADVVARFGSEGAVAHRLAAGVDERPPVTTDPPPDLVVTTELEPPAERVDTAAFVAKALADELGRRLADRALACTRVAVLAETEHGERLERLWRHEGALDPPAVADRVRWQLDGWLNGPLAARPTAGITRLRLVPDEVGPATGRQLGFWGGEGAAADRATRALARVQGLLGPDAVTVPEWRGGRGPIDQLELVPVHAVDLGVDRPATRPEAVRAPWPGRLPGLAPAVVPPEPMPAEVLDVEDRLVRVGGRGSASAAPHRVVLAGRPARTVIAWAGPWPAEERWWDPERRRRRARLQVVLDDGSAHLLAVEGGSWWLEASYD